MRIRRPALADDPYRLYDRAARWERAPEVGDAPVRTYETILASAVHADTAHAFVVSSRFRSKSFRSLACTVLRVDFAGKLHLFAGAVIRDRVAHGGTEVLRYPGTFLRRGGAESSNDHNQPDSSHYGAPISHL